MKGGEGIAETFLNGGETVPESARLEILDSYQLLDSEPDDSYELLCRVAAQLCGAPIAMINLVDRTRQWSLAAYGDIDREVPREWSFCARVVEARAPITVPAAAEDERFSGNPLVVGRPRVRSYAGVPLTVHGGATLGAVCVLDVRDREFDDGHLEVLRGLAEQVSALLELRRIRLLLLLLQPPPADPDGRDRDVAGARRGLDARSAWVLGQLVPGGDRSAGTGETWRADLPDGVPDVPGLSQLTNRELDIVGRLLGGDRVPLIAETLFLSQSTVRNHLSSVFRKLAIGSQQQLIDLLRRADPVRRGTAADRP